MTDPVIYGEYQVRPAGWRWEIWYSPSDGDAPYRLPNMLFWREDSAKRVALALFFAVLRERQRATQKSRPYSGD